MAKRQFLNASSIELTRGTMMPSGGSGMGGVLVRAVPARQESQGRTDLGNDLGEELTLGMILGKN